MVQAETRQKSRVLRLLGYGLAIICLAWLLHDFHIVRALHDMANADWRWVLLGVVFDVLSYGVQAVRWKFLLAPFGRVRLNNAIRAVYAGLFANLVFPLRPGEFLRSYLISDSEGISLGLVLGSVGVERLVDLVIATASLAVVSLFVELPRRFKRAADTMGIITLVLLAIVVIVILYLEIKLSGKTNAQPKKKSEEEIEVEEDSARPSLRNKAMAMLLGLHAMGTAPSFYPAVLMSLLMPFCQVVALWCMMRSYGLGLSFMAAVVVLLVINLGVSIPNAPANFGSYPFFCVLGLSVFQVEKTTATGFSIFAFLALTLPFVFLGFAAILRSGLSFRSLREKVGSLPQQTRNLTVHP